MTGENKLDLESYGCPKCQWRDKLVPGDIVELRFPDWWLEDPNEQTKLQIQAQGLRGVVIKALGQHEDSAGLLDYLIWWNHDDPRYDIWFNSWPDNRAPEAVLKKLDEKDKRGNGQLLEDFRKCFEKVPDNHGNNAPHFHEKGKNNDGRETR
jgi:hypothetical protein